MSSFFSSCTPGRWRGDYTETPREKLRDRQSARVLFIGNSFTMGLPDAFRREAARRGKRVHVASSAHDRWTLLRHSRSAETKNLLESPWDIVVFQERSDRPGKWWERNFFMIPALGPMAGNAARNGALPVMFQTWGYGEDTRLMSAKVAAGCDLAARDLGGIPVIRVGDAWARQDTRRLFQADGKHPSARGNEITARVFCDAFWGGRSAQ